MRSEEYKNKRCFYLSRNWNGEISRKSGDILILIKDRSKFHLVDRKIEYIFDVPSFRELVEFIGFFVVAQSFWFERVPRLPENKTLNLNLQVASCNFAAVAEMGIIWNSCLAIIFSS